MDFGQPQKQFGENEVERKDTLHEILAMERYAKNEMIISTDSLSSPRTRELCKNKLEKCAYYASKGMCRDLSRMDFMMSNCPLACQMCDVVENFERCVGMRSTKVEPLFTSSDEEEGTVMTVDAFFKAGRDEGTWVGQKTELEMDLGFIVQPMESNNFEDPWIVKIENFMSEQECKDFIQNDGSDENRMETLILERISSSFQLPSTHFSPFQVNRFNANTSRVNGGIQHDYSIHDVWKPAGPKVLSFYLTLSIVEEGGELGFPELDWLLIQPKIGQLIMWPNVVSTNPEKDDKRMIREELPVIMGEKHSAHVSAHLYDWQDAKERQCV